MYCVKCGKQLPDDAVFCSSCGTAQGATPKLEPLKVLPYDYKEDWNPFDPTKRERESRSQLLVQFAHVYRFSVNRGMYEVFATIQPLWPGVAAAHMKMERNILESSDTGGADVYKLQVNLPSGNYSIEVNGERKTITLSPDRLVSISFRRHDI